jgi:6-phosphogluconolactonase
MTRSPGSRLLLSVLLLAACGGGGGGGGAGSGGGSGGGAAGSGGGAGSGPAGAGGGAGSATAGAGGGVAGAGGGVAGTGGNTAGGAGGGAGSATAGAGGGAAGRGGASGAAGAAGRGGASGGAAGTAGAAGRGGAGGGAAGAAGEATVYVSGSSSTISILALDLATGGLTSRGTAPGGTSPTYLAFDPANRYLFAGNGGNGRVTGFTIGAMGALTNIGDASTAGMVGSMSYMAAVTHVSVHPTGSWVMTAHFNSGHIAVSPVGASGVPGAPVAVQRPANEAHQIVSDASGRHVFVPCRSGNVVAQYQFNSANGALAASVPPTVQAATGAGPRHLAFHPSQQFAYVINELNGTMTSYVYDATAGLMSMPQTVSTVPAGVNETSSAHVVVHPSGNFVYGSNRTHNSIVMFRVDGTTGRLTLIGHETGGGMVRTPRDFGMDPGGRYLLVANQGTNNVLVFRINTADGTLTRVGDPLTVPASPQFAGAIILP